MTMRAIGIVVLMAALVALGWALNDALRAPSPTEVTPIVLDTNGERPEREKSGPGKQGKNKGPGTGGATGGATSGGGSGAQPALPPPVPAGGNDDDGPDDGDDDTGDDGGGTDD